MKWDDIKTDGKRVQNDFNTGCFFSGKKPRVLSTLRKKPFENYVRKGESPGNKHFLLFLK